MLGAARILLKVTRPLLVQRTNDQSSRSSLACWSIQSFLQVARVFSSTSSRCPGPFVASVLLLCRRGHRTSGNPPQVLPAPWSAKRASVILWGLRGVGGSDARHNVTLDSGPRECSPVSSEPRGCLSATPPTLLRHFVFSWSAAAWSKRLTWHIFGRDSATAGSAGARTLCFRCLSSLTPESL